MEWQYQKVQVCCLSEKFLVIVNRNRLNNITIFEEEYRCIMWCLTLTTSITQHECSCIIKISTLNIHQILDLDGKIHITPTSKISYQETELSTSVLRSVLVFSRHSRVYVNE